MPWKFFPQFSTSGTTVSPKILRNLACDETFVRIEDYLVLEEEVIQVASELKPQVRSDQMTALSGKTVQKLKKKLAGCQSISSLLEKPDVRDGIPKPLYDELEGWERSRSALEGKLHEARVAFEAELPQKRDLLWDTIKDPLICEGLFGLNPDFLDLLETNWGKWRNSTRDKKNRERERTLISYLSRMVAKNSTAGTIGPTVGGCFDRDLEKGVTLSWAAEKGAQNEISDRQGFMSHWAAQQLASLMMESDSVLLDLPMYLHPCAFLVDDKIECLFYVPKHPFFPSQTEVTVSEGIVSFTREAAVDKISFSQRGSKADREEFLSLARGGWFKSGLSIPYGTEEPLRYLIATLERVEKPSSDTIEWIERLKKFNGWKDRFVSSDLLSKKSAFLAAEEEFQSLTQGDTRRGSGTYYADRFIFFEECKRSIDQFTFGQPLIDEMETNYGRSLMLQAPYWIASILPVIFHTEDAKATYLASAENDEDQRTQGKRFAAVARTLLNPASRKIDSAMLEDEECGEACIGELTELIKRSKMICARLAEGDSFQDLGSEWAGYETAFESFMVQFGHLAPVFLSGIDLQVAASSQEAIERGDFLLVADSLVFGTTMNLTLLNYFSTDRQRDEKAMEIMLQSLTKSEEDRWCGFTFIAAQTSKFSPGLSPGYDLELMGPSAKSDPRKLSLRDVRIECEEEEAHIVTTKGGDRITLNLGYPMQMRVDRKRLIDDVGKHCPRIQVGKTVLQRETWLVPCEDVDLSAKGAEDPFGLYVDALRLRRKLNLPTQVFVDPSGPKKNIMIDFRVFFLVEVLATLVRENESLLVTEMLPSMDEFWLRPPKGAHSMNIGMMPFIYFQPSPNSQEK